MTLSLDYDGSMILRFGRGGRPRRGLSPAANAEVPGLSTINQDAIIALRGRPANVPGSEAATYRATKAK